MWTRFYDLYGGGSAKLDADSIWIEADEGEAIYWFRLIFGRDPLNVTCECCGPDYSVYESDFRPEAGDKIVYSEDIKKFDIERRKGK